MIRLFLVFFLFLSFSFAEEYPKTFSQLGTPLYKAVEPISLYKDVEGLNIRIESFLQSVEKMKADGFKLDKSQSKNALKRYLLALRKLQKEYDYLVHLLDENISKSIDKNDYELFVKLTSYEFDGLLKNPNLRNKAMTFYGNNEGKKRSIVLDKNREHTKLLEETTKEFYNLSIKSTYDSKSKKKTSKQSVVMQAVLKDDHIYLSIKNKNYYDVTVKIKATYKNYVQSAGTKDVIVVKAKSTLAYTKLSKTANNGEYRYSYRWIIGNKDAVHDDSYIYRLPYAVGSSHVVSQGFNGTKTHKGRSRYAVDFAMKIGTKLYASRGGVVVRTKSNSNRGGYHKKFASSGNYVTIMHDDSTMATYYHLKKNGVTVKIGDKVSRGQHIGYSGNTGYSSGPHLHFAIFRAISAYATQTIAMNFISENGLVHEPIRGKYYKAK